MYIMYYLLQSYVRKAHHCKVTQQFNTRVPVDITSVVIRGGLHVMLLSRDIVTVCAHVTLSYRLSVQVCTRHVI